MSIFKRPLRLGLIAGLLASSTAAHADVRFERAEARQPSNQRLLYFEDHWQRFENDRLVERTVLYRCGDGTAFARKNLDYRKSLEIPEFDFIDTRSNFREGLRWRNNQPELWVIASGQSKERSRILSSQDQVVADAGFDEFIRRQWPSLLSNRPVPLSFAVPSRLQAYNFQLNRTGSTQIQGEKAQTFRLKLGGLLGWLAPHIDVAYATDDQRLLRFTGLSNLRDDRGDSQLNTQIEFISQKNVETTSLQAAREVKLRQCSVQPG
jgi:hypothetical protein